VAAARGRDVMRRAVANTVTTLLVAAVSAAAQQPVPKPTPATIDTAKDPHAAQPERPTVATHAGTVARGWFEIETGVERDRIDPNATLISTPTVFKIGLAARVQLSLYGTVIRPPEGSASFGDAAIGVKWRLVEDAPVLGDFAVLPGIKFPTGSAETGTETTDVSLLLISSHDIGDVAMDLNVGYTYRSGDGTNAPTNATLWTASFGGPLAGALGWAAECYGYPATRGPSGQASIVALLGGPTFTVRPWLVFDAGLIIPVSGPQSRALYAGAVYNVGRLWSPRR
jgi:hypothetical protein